MTHYAKRNPVQLRRTTNDPTNQKPNAYSEHGDRLDNGHRWNANLQRAWRGDGVLSCVCAPSALRPGAQGAHRSRALQAQVNPSGGSVEDEAVAKSKIEASGWTGEAIVASGDIVDSRIGTMLSGNYIGFEWGDADLFFCISCGRVSLHSSDASWHCRLCGESEDHVGVYDPRDAWLAAGNRVQYRRTA